MPDTQLLQTKAGNYDTPVGVGGAINNNTGEAIPQAAAANYYAQTGQNQPPVIPITKLTQGQAPATAPVLPPPTGAAGLAGHINATQDAYTQSLDQNAASASTAKDASLQALIAGLKGQSGQSALTDAAYAGGVDPLSKELAAANNQLVAEQVSARHQAEALAANPGGLSSGALASRIDDINRQSLSKQADLAVIQMAKQGQYDSAKAIADRAVQVALEKQKQTIDALQLAYTDNKDLFTKAEQRQFEAAQGDRNRKLDEDAARRTADYAQLIREHDPAYQADLAKKRLENQQLADLNGTPNDPITALSNAILGNESNGSYSTLSPVLPSGSAKGQRSYGKYQVLESNIPSWAQKYYGQSLTKEEFLNNPDAQEAVQKGYMTELWNKYGNVKDVASVYFTGVPYAQAVKEGRKDQATGMTVQDYAAKAEKAFNASTAAPTTNPAATAALNVVLGSTKLTAAQKQTVITSVKRGEDPLAVIKNQAKDIMGQTEATKLTSYEAADSAMQNFAKALQAYYDGGGDTGILSGNFEKVINKLGTVKDPAKVALATQVAISLQAYRNAISGTAYSNQEGKEISTVFPGINKSQGLNKAIIDGRIAADKSIIDGIYGTALGQKTYQDLLAAYGQTPATGPTTSGPNGIFNTNKDASGRISGGVINGISFTVQY